MARKVKVAVQTEITTDDIIDELLRTLSFKEIHKFIVKLDKECQDWGVTENLYKHFKKEMEKYPQESCGKVTSNIVCDIPFD
jgi:hypothetical protein